MKVRGTTALVATLATALIAAGCGDSESSSTDGGSKTGADSGDGATLRVLEAGGESGEAMQKAYIDPWQAETGNEVIRESPSTLGKLQAQVKAGNVTDSLVELDSISAVGAEALGLTEPIDYTRVDPAAPLDDFARQDFGLGWSYYSTIATWKKGAAPIDDWSDFFDPDRDGERAIPDFPSFVLPIAAVASGIAPEDLYPLDLDRAFGQLDRLSGRYLLWSSGAQPPQQLINGEATYAMAWSGRVVNNPELEYTFNQGLLDLSYMVIPKGAPNVAEAESLLHEFTDPERQLAATEIIPYTGAAKGAAAQAPKDLLPKLPTSPENAAVQFNQDPAWWAANYEDVLKRWEQWKRTQ